MLNIKVVRSGCASCEKLEQLCREIINDNKIEALLEKVSDINKFADLGILMTSGLIINDKVMSSGKLPAKWTLEKWITEKA